jgi:hypothetical protein
MDSITPELRGRFLRFREVYEFTLAKLQEEGAIGAVVSVKVWEAAQREVPLTPLMSPDPFFVNPDPFIQTNFVQSPG